MHRRTKEFVNSRRIKYSRSVSSENSSITNPYIALYARDSTIQTKIPIT